MIKEENRIFTNLLGNDSPDLTALQNQEVIGKIQ